MPLDGNLAVADFEKMQNSQLAHIAFEALDVYKKEKKQSPGKYLNKIGLILDNDALGTLFLNKMMINTFRNHYRYLNILTLTNIFDTHNIL